MGLYSLPPTLGHETVMNFSPIFKLYQIAQFSCMISDMLSEKV
jgi:hypothetical protein